MMKKNYDIKINIVILEGSSASGTLVIQRYLTGPLKEDSKSNIDARYEVKNVEINGKKVRLQIWDLDPKSWFWKERFDFLLPSNGSSYLVRYKDRAEKANGAIFFYDISNRATFIHLHDSIQLFREYTEDIPIMLAGVSLGFEEDKVITSDEGLKISKRYNLDGFIEVSPKTGKNVEELFNPIIHLALQAHFKKKVEFLKEEDVKNRLNHLGAKLKDLGVDSKKLEITWNSFIEFMDQGFSLVIGAQEFPVIKKQVKINGNYLIPYARYLESKLLNQLPNFFFSFRSLDLDSILRLYRRSKDKVDINYIHDLEENYIHNLEKRFNPRDFHNLEKRVSGKKIFLEFPREPLKLIFPVNDLLTLKLEHDKTFIYINGKKFIQCIRLSLQIPPETRHLYEEIESIDEAAEAYKQFLWKNRIVEGPMAQPSRLQNRSITPEQEFWGHCSNIQAWVEHEYDTRLLHSNLSFRLLKELSDAGDPKAKAKFKEEIAIRLESGYPSVVNYLLEQGYYRYLDKDQLKTLLEDYTDVDLNEPFLDGNQDAKKYIRYRIKRSLKEILIIGLVKDIGLKFMRLPKDDRKTLLIVGNELEFLKYLINDLFEDAVIPMLIDELNTIITCSNTKEALRVIEERYNDIAMILVDPMIPDHWMDTEKFSQYIKSDDRYKHILVEFLQLLDMQIFDMQIFEVIELTESPYVEIEEILDGVSVKDIICENNSNKVFFLVDHDTKSFWTYIGPKSSINQMRVGMFWAWLQQQLKLYYTPNHLNMYSPKFQDIMNKLVFRVKADRDREIKKMEETRLKMPEGSQIQNKKATPPHIKKKYRYFRQKS